MMEWWSGGGVAEHALPRCQSLGRNTDARIMPQVFNQHSNIPVFHYSKASQETAEPILFSPAEPVD
jgi:hypothetical protein